MRLSKILFLSVFSVFFSAGVRAQIEIAHLTTKGLSSTGVGGFIHGAIPVGKADDIGLEAGIYAFNATSNTHLLFLPLLVSFRHAFSPNGTGIYVEPLAGYTIGSTDIPQTDAGGNTLYNTDGTEKDIKASGPAAGLGVGYIIPSSSVPLNFGIRYERVFVSGGAPAQSLIAFRVAWSLLTAKRLKGA
jgi:hypothetical protein